MLKFDTYNVVFQEVPGEVTLAINLSNCPNSCKGCHSKHLQQDIGEELTDELLQTMIEKYAQAITCVCFMGGDASPHEVNRLATIIKTNLSGRLKVAWYSGKDSLPLDFSVLPFNFIKLGSYIETYGGLTSEHTNQRFYEVQNGVLYDKTHLFSMLNGV